MNFDSNGLWRERSVDKKAQITLSFYERAASFTVFSTDNSSRKPLAKIPLSMESALFMADMLKRLKKTDGSLRLNYRSQQWDRNSNKFVNGDGIIFFRDDKGRFGLEVVPKNGESVRFIFRGRTSFSDGQEPLSEEKRSEIGLDILLHVLAVQFGIASLLVRFNPVTQYQRGGNGNNNGGNNRSGDYNSSSKQSSDDDDRIWGD